MRKLQMTFAMNYSASKIFYTVIFINIYIAKRCAQDLISMVDSLQPPSRINLNLPVILLQSNSSYAELRSFCKKSIFKKIVKLTTGCVFSANNRLIKQIDGCLMRGPISVVLLDIYFCNMKEDLVEPSKPQNPYKIFNWLFYLSSFYKILQ